MVFSGHEKNYVAIVSTLAIPTGTDLALDRPILSGVYDGFQRIRKAKWLWYVRGGNG